MPLAAFPLTPFRQRSVFGAVAGVALTLRAQCQSPKGISLLGISRQSASVAAAPRRHSQKPVVFGFSPCSTARLNADAV